MLGLGSSLAKGGASLLTYVKDNLKLYLDFKKNRSDTLAFPSEGSTEFIYREYIDCGNGIGNQLGDNYAGDLTISMWIKADATFTEGIFGIGDFDGTYGDLYIRLHGNNLQFYLNNNWRREIAYTDTGWNHIACVYKSESESDSKLYVNGISVGSATGAFPSASDLDFNGNKTTIGAYFNNQKDFTGKMANVAVWSRALSLEEVQSVMNKSYSQLGSVEKTSLVSWWGLDNDTAMQSNVSTFLDNTTGADGTWDNSGGVMTISSDRYRYFNHFIPSAVSDTSKKMKFTITAKKAGSGSVSLWFKGNTIDTFPLTNNYQTFTINMYNQTVGDNFVKFTGASESNQVIVTKFDAQYYGSYDSHGSNNGNNNYVAPVFTESLSSDGLTYGSISQLGGNAPILPRAIDIAESFADAIGDGSASFDGSSDYVDIGNTFQSVFQSAFTISAWIKPEDGQPSGINALFGSDSTSDQDRFRIMLKTDGKIGLLYKTDNNNTGEIDSNTTNAVFSNGATDWTHIAITVSQSSTTITGILYVNGIVTASSFSGSHEALSMADFATTTNFAIGGANRGGSLTQHFDGQISQVGIWQGALTQSQIQSVMESTSYAKIPADIKSTLGSELVVDMDTWTMFAGTATLDTSTNSVTMKQEEGGSNIAFTNYFNGASLLNSNLANGFYKLSFNVSWDNLPTSRKIHIYENGTNVVSTDMVLGKNVRYFNKTGANNVNHSLSLLSTSGNNTNGIVISNLSLKEVTNDIVAYFPLDGSSSANGVTQDVTTGEVLGSELVQDSDWQEGTGWTDTGDNTWTYTSGTTSSLFIENVSGLTVGNLYKIQYTITSKTGNVSLKWEGINFFDGGVAINSTVGTHTYYGVATRDDVGFRHNGGTGTIGLSNPTLKQVTSNTGVLK